ncbi:MAG: DUF4349 domain-containing protein [Hyphomicrobiales bacterium]|nr:DUF4349 domain-containing protein [Hyphomicrobiales bacterium]
MKMHFSVFFLLPVLILAGCNSAVNLQTDQESDSFKLSNTALDRSQFNNRKIAETHKLRIKTTTVKLKLRHQRDLEKCISLQCNILESSLVSKKRGSIKAVISPENLKIYLEFLEEGQGELSSHQVLAEDKTFEYIDVNARLTNLESLRNRLKTLLESHDVTDVENILKIEKELRNVQEKLDSSKGKMNHLLSVTNNSTIHIRYRVPNHAIDIEQPYENLGNSFKAARSAFIYSVSSVIEFVGGALPWIPIFFAGLWLTINMFRIIFGKIILKRLIFWKKDRPANLSKID